MSQNTEILRLVDDLERKYAEGNLPARELARRLATLPDDAQVDARAVRMLGSVIEQLRSDRTLILAAFKAHLINTDLP